VGEGCVDIVRGGRGRALCLFLVSERNWMDRGRRTNRLFGGRLIFGGGIGRAFIYGGEHLKGRVEGGGDELGGWNFVWRCGRVTCRDFTPLVEKKMWFGFGGAFNVQIV
jgi:hypothetical protein